VGPRWVQIPPGPGGRSYAGCRAEVRELLDGRLLVFYQDRCLNTLPSPGAAFVLRPRGAPSAQRGRPARSGSPPAIAQRLQEPRSGRGPLGALLKDGAAAVRRASLLPRAPPARRRRSRPGHCVPPGLSPAGGTPHVGLGHPALRRSRGRELGDRRTRGPAPGGSSARSGASV
jgi:hypothetical protein